MIVTASSAFCESPAESFVFAYFLIVSFVSSSPIVIHAGSFCGLFVGVQTCGGGGGGLSFPQISSPFGPVGLVAHGESVQIYATLCISVPLGVLLSIFTGTVKIYFPEFAGSGVFFLQTRAIRVVPLYVVLVHVQSLVTSAHDGFFTEISPFHERCSGNVSFTMTLFASTLLGFSMT